MGDDSHFSCALSAVLIARVKRTVGDDGPQRLLAESGSERTLAYLTDIGNWISYDEAMALLGAGATTTGDPLFARHVGGDFVAQLAGSANSSVLRALGSPEALMRKVAQAGHRFSTSADLEAVEVRPGFAEIRATASPGFARHHLHCEWTMGLLTQATVLFGLPPAGVEQDQCAADGAECCRYRVTWDASALDDADPAERIATLQKQLDAMSERLQSVFDTAADLIASGDLDGTLARITDRAAWQVRAPRYLLAVRPTPAAELLCHQKGFDADEAHAVAERVLTEDPATLPGHWLTVEVSSELHRYGALVAVHKPGATFFPHERQLLEVYGRYAATALDTATALAEAKARHEEAQRRYEESRALIRLARRLAQAATSDQVAQRLADAVPGVIDCDRVSVYLWSPERGELLRQGEGVLPSVRPEDVDQLADWVARPDPEPFFIDLEVSPVRHALQEVGAVAAVAVPIATRERFLGCFVVSVTARPERLGCTPELVERLSGVAAHAITALENGRLVDHITHQATHDPLTGAANRTAFHEQLSAATRAQRESRASSALFYIDLDGFKPINDSYGHGVGDEVLRAVTARLSECVRAGDTVARLGGDEFAVLVEGIVDDAHMAAVSARLEHAFARPFEACGRSVAVGASIGCAVWLDDGDPEALLREADAAMYERKRAARR